MRWLSPVAALVLTVLVGAALFAFLGKDPMSSLYVFLVAPLENLRGWCEVGVKMTPLLLCAAGLTLCYRANIWNINCIKRCKCIIHGIFTIIIHMIIGNRYNVCP